MAAFAQPRTWRTLQRHPVSAKYPNLKGKALERMREGVKKFGNVTGRKVKLAPDPDDGNKIKIADAWQFYQACIENDLKPLFEQVKLPKGMTLEEWVEMVNDTRRHEDEEVISKRVEERRGRVIKAREAGESIRAIAEKEDVSTTTVQRDLETVSGVTPVTAADNGTSTVTGSDGKTYPASKPKIFCDRCTRIGETKGCPMCAELRKAPKGKAKAKSESKEDDEVKDHFGNVVPKKCRDAFCDTWAQETFDFLSVTSETFRKRRIADGMKKREKRLPFFKSKDVTDGVGFVIDYLDKLIEHFKTQRLAGVCPMCSGEGCTDCLRSGLVPREIYQGLKKTAKERKHASADA